MHPILEKQGVKWDEATGTVSDAKRRSPLVPLTEAKQPPNAAIIQIRAFRNQESLR
jgi:hypothetical protein